MCTPPKGDLPPVAPGLVIAGHYAIASANIFPAVVNMAKDPRVCLHDGRVGIAGHLVAVDYDHSMVLIRFEDGLKVGIVALPDQPDQKSGLDLKTAAIIRQFLHDYFAGWGKYVPDKPAF